MTGHETCLPLTADISLLAYLPPAAVLVPFLGALVTALLSKREKVRDAVVIAANGLTLLAVVLMYRPVIEGVRYHGHLYRCLEFELPLFMDLGINFRVDATSFIIALATSFIWLVSCIYATSYMSREHARGRYYFFVLLTLAANIGVLVTRDFFSLFLFFELMAVFSFVLVVHEETKEAMDAGYLYLFMSIIGGLFLLGGVVLMHIFSGTTEIAPIAHLLDGVPAGLKYLMAVLMIVGFGVKAGVFFLHVWLPEAHPIAPTPASALLSGLIIKAGAYGILRTVNTLFAPSGGADAHAALPAAGLMLSRLGYWLIWVGAVTMFLGVINALISANCKRMLAYHSVSQMGYIVLGLGCAAFLGREGAMGLAGAVYHIINHALFKSALFLSVGAVYFRTRELDMYKLGGMLRNMPFVAVTCFIAVMGISGVPLFNGFASKTILHHAVIEAYERTVAVNRPDRWLYTAEIIFCLTAFGTFCSNLKMWLFVFVWKRPEKFREARPAPLSMKIALGALSTLILFIGLRPNWLLEHFIGPALADFGFDPSSHAYHLLYNTHAGEGIRSTIPILYDPATLSFINRPVVYNLVACGLAVLGGGLTFILGYRFGWFHVPVPGWVALKYWYLMLARGFFYVVSRPSRFVSRAVDDFYVFAARLLLDVPQWFSIMRRKVKNLLVPVIIGLSGETHISLWQEELDVFLELERRDSFRRAMGRHHVDLIREGMGSKQRWMMLEDKKDKARREALGIIRQEEMIVRRTEEAMTRAGIARGARRERLLDFLRLLSRIRKSGDAAGSLERLRTVERIMADISGKKMIVGEDIIVSFAREVRDKLDYMAGEADFLEEFLDKAVRKAFQLEASLRGIEQGVLEKTSCWARKMIRIAAEVLTEERVPWDVDRYVSQKEVAEARTAIRRYTRDISFNVMIMVLLVVLTVILAGM